MLISALMNVAETLLKIKSLGFTQQELANKLQVSFPTLNSWILAKSQPRKSHLLAIESLYFELFGTDSLDKIDLISKKEFIYKLNDRNLVKSIIKNRDILDNLTLKMTYNTNSIEGNTLTEQDTAEIIFKQKVLANHSLIEQLEANNHRQAFLFALKLVDDGEITKEKILEMHRILTAGILDNAGFLRYHSVRILGSGVATANYLKLPELIENFCQNFNSKPQDIIQHIAISHAKFEQIHPFSDGNGRVGRLLMTIMALQHGLAPVLVLQERKQAYYKYLRKAQLEADTSFLEYFVAEMILEAAKIIKLI